MTKLWSSLCSDPSTWTPPYLWSQEVQTNTSPTHGGININTKLGTHCYRGRIAPLQSTQYQHGWEMTISHLTHADSVTATRDERPPMANGAGEMTAWNSLSVGEMCPCGGAASDRMLRPCASAVCASRKTFPNSR